MNLLVVSFRYEENMNQIYSTNWVNISINYNEL